MHLRYDGKEPSTVRIGDRPVMPGDVITDPELVADLKSREGFVSITDFAPPDEPAPTRTKHRTKE